MICVIDYGIGNLRSAQKAFEYIGANSLLTSDATLIKQAKGLVLPGVGSFGRPMDALIKTGTCDLLKERIEAGVPFLGICIGFQMLFETSDESPSSRGLGVLGGNVEVLSPKVKRPQMQWNQVEIERDDSILFRNMDPSPWMYFVHSYAPSPTDPRNIVGRCNYGEDIVCAIEQENIFGVQFHPEKSGSAGITLLRNFVDKVSG